MIGLTKIVVKGWLLSMCAVAFGLSGVSSAQVQPAKKTSPAPAASLSPKGPLTSLKSTPPTPEQKKKAESQMRKDDGAFVENKGQWKGDGRYLVRSQNLRVWLTDKGWLLDQFKQVVQGKQTGAMGQVVSMEFAGGNPRPVLLPNAFNGNVRDYMGPAAMGKIPSVKAYGEVTAREVYKGIDVRSYLDHGRTRFDFIVKPGADPSQAKLSILGSNGVSVSTKGELVAKTNVGDLDFGGLKAYQYVKGAVVPVEVAFTQLDKNLFGFKLGAYDKAAELTIDPIVYGTFYGADDGWDEIHSVVTDKNGGVFLTGFTESPSFPKIVGPYGFQLHSNRDAFMTKLQGDVYSHDYAAYFGGNQDDSGDWLQVDPNGDIWVAGKTLSTDFPGNVNPNINHLVIDPLYSAVDFLDTPNGGTFDLIYTLSDGSATRITAPFDASPLTVQNALVAQLGHSGQISVTGGSMPSGPMTIALPNSLPGAVTVDATNTKGTFVVSDGDQVVSPFGTPSPTSYLLTQVSGTVTAGTFVLTGTDGGSFNFTTAPIAFNATPATVQAAIIAGGAPAGSVICNAVSGLGTLPGSPIAILFTQNHVNVADLVDSGSTALTGGVYSATERSNVSITYDPSRSVPTGGYFGLSVLAEAVAQNQALPAIQYNETAVNFQGYLNTLPQLSGHLFVQVIPGTGAETTLPKATYVIEWVPNDGGQLNTSNVVVDNSTVHPRAHFIVNKAANEFIMRWKNTGLTGIQSLDPELGNEKAIVIDSAAEYDVAGFVVRKQLDGSGRVVMDIAGETQSAVGGLPGYAGQDSYLLQYFFDPTQPAPGITLDPAASKYIGDDPSVPIAVQGLAVDTVGDIYLGGSAVFGGGTVDTSVNPIFVTTPNVFTNISNASNGRLLRNSDWFLRKYSPTGSLIWSGLIGGDGFDYAGGLVMDVDGTVKHIGSCVAVDGSGDAYITGIADSFNFPRTRGVVGETFVNNPLMSVTKVSADGSQILYSTHLNSSSGSGYMRGSASGVFMSGAEPGGIAVDARGNAYITGNVRASSVNFPHPTGNNEWNFPTGQAGSFVAVTQDATQATPGVTNTPDLPTQDGFLNVLNSTGTALTFGTYIGGNLDEVLHSPYVDAFGDCWLMGSTDSVRLYEAPTRPNPFKVNSRLPANFITSLAFKPEPDLSALGDGSSKVVAYATLDNEGLGIDPQPYIGIPFLVGPVEVDTGPVFYSRDGFVVRYRLGLPVINGLTFDSPTLAGGLGSTTNAHILLSSGAPAGGMPVLVTLSSTNAASLSSAQPLGQLVVTIPAGSTSGTFPIYTSAVTDLTNVDVQAEFEENFKVGRLVVAPWLQQFVVTPSSIVGGNTAVGQIRLFQNAPSGGITVSMSSDSTFASAGNSVTVPAGQSAAIFNVTSTGVQTTSVATLTAGLLGVGLTQELTVNPANLLTVTFNPQHVNGGTATTGTVTLDGNPGSTGFTVDLAVLGSPAGYSTVPTTLTFFPTDTSKTFTLMTPYEPANIVRTVSATRAAQGPYSAETITGSVNVDTNDVSLVTVSPNPVNGGQIATATVTLAKPADTNGITIALTSSSPTVTILGQLGYGQNATVVIPAGAATSAPISIKTTGSATPFAGLDVTITASVVGGVVKSTVLHVNPISLSAFTVSPVAIGGGNSATGTVTLAFAVAFPVSVDVTTDSAYTHLTSPVLIPANTLTQTFTINTDPVPSTVTANLTASISGGTPLLATLAIGQQLAQSIAVVPATVNGGSGSAATVTLNSAAPAVGTPITMHSSDPRVTLQGDGAVFGQTVTVTAKSTSTVSVPIHTTSNVDPYDVTISATATSTVSANLHVNGVSNTFTGFTISPSTVGGGAPSTGTLTLSAPTPIDVQVVVVSDSALTHFTSPVTIFAGHSSATFAITTDPVSSDSTAHFTATMGASPVVTKAASLTIVAPRLMGIRFTPSRVRGGRQVTYTLVFNAATPAGIAVAMTNSNPNILKLDPSFTTTTQVGTLTSNNALTFRVSRSLGAIVTATYNGVSVSGLLVVTR